VSDRRKPLPGSWIEAELYELTTVNYGKALSAGMRAIDGCVPVIGSSGIVGVHDEAIVDGPCLVVGRKGAAGSVHLVRESSWPIDTAYYIQPPQEIELVYLSLFLSTCELGTLDKSTAIPSLSRDDLYRVPVPVAPRSEQTRIVEKLEELLSDLDAGVAELKAAQKTLAQYRQSLLKAAVEGALTADWRAAQANANVTKGSTSKAPKPNHPTETGAQLLERILTERRARWEAKQLAKFKEQGKAPPKDWQKKYPEPVQADTADLPTLPKGWVWSTGEMLFSWGSGDFLPASAQVEGNNPVYGGNGINGRHNVANVGHATIVIGRVGVHCGNVYRTESSAWVTDNAIYATSKHDLITWQYSELAMKAANLGSSSKGGAQPFISQKILNDTFIALPPLCEQLLIADEYGDAIRATAELTKGIEISLKQFTAQRQNILRAAFTGQLVPQDTSDEPASVLLERIRAERVEREKKPKVRKSKQPKEITAMVNKLVEVLAEAADWLPAQEAFRRCGVADGSDTDQIEALYAELRALDKSGRLAVEAVTDAQGRKLHDRLKLLAG
jgi:type I restriction enzyme, S subunit